MSVAVGLSLRPVWIDELRRCGREAIDVIEVLIDDFVQAPRAQLRELQRLGRRWPLLAHGVGLGIGGAEGVDSAYLDGIAEACSRIDARWYTEHLAFVRAGGIELGQFVALDDDDETLALLKHRGAQVRARVGRPLLLENPADVLGTFSRSPEHGRPELRGRRMGRAYTRCLHAAGAGALLDLTNLLYDARNGGWSPDAFFAEFDFERVLQIHLAGGVEREGLWIDSHSRPVEVEAYALLTEVASRAPNLRAVIIEWDEGLPSLTEILTEVEVARGLVARSREQR